MSQFSKGPKGDKAVNQAEKHGKEIETFKKGTTHNLTQFNILTRATWTTVRWPSSSARRRLSMVKQQLIQFLSCRTT